LLLFKIGGGENYLVIRLKIDIAGRGDKGGGVAEL
jgi:hypothetical protein